MEEKKRLGLGEWLKEMKVRYWRRGGREEGWVKKMGGKRRRLGSGKRWRRRRLGLGDRA